MLTLRGNKRDRCAFCHFVARKCPEYNRFVEKTPNCPPDRSSRFAGTTLKIAGVFCKMYQDAILLDE